MAAMRWKTAAILLGIASVTLGLVLPLIRSKPISANPPAESFTQTCARLGVPYPPRRILLCALKQERELELWGEGKTGTMRLLRTYPIAAASGGPGPKRREGDLQVPEGVYRVNRFNTHSRYHLSLGLNYPNKSDRLLGSRKPGNDIYIHGNQVSAGCLAMTDAKIEEIFVAASTAHEPVQVLIFPCRMTGNAYRKLKEAYPQHVKFWKQLEPIYLSFESAHLMPKVTIDAKGNYVVSPSPD